jgi:hypothetical protein
MILSPRRRANTTREAAGKTTTVERLAMKKFKSHKVVEAAKIIAYGIDHSDNNSLLLELEDGHTKRVPHVDRFRPTQADLGYLIRYSDGYVSWSPTKAFEEGYTEEGEHAGLPVAGYRPQNDEKVRVVNENKILEERVLRQIDQLKHENEIAKSNEQVLPYDPRMLALAFTGIQDAFMWLNRAVFQPDRIVLPEDSDK